MDSIFIYNDKVNEICRLFAVVTLLGAKLGDDGEPAVELILSDSPLYILDNRRTIVGLPRMDRELPWVIDHTEEGVFMCVRIDLDFI